MRCLTISIAIEVTKEEGKSRSENSKSPQKEEKKVAPSNQEVSQEFEHQLSDKWTFWYVYDISHEERKRKKGKARWQREYKLNDVHTFATIEDFWRLFNNIVGVKDLIPNTDYLLFKQGIKPEWEDPKNNDGGKWVITLPLEAAIANEGLEDSCEYAWNNIIYMMIGANIDQELYDIINGIIYSIRDKHHRISVWVSDNSEPSLLKKIGAKIREVSKFDKEHVLEYQVHKKAIQHNLDNESFLKA